MSPTSLSSSMMLDGEVIVAISSSDRSIDICSSSSSMTVVSMGACRGSALVAGAGMDGEEAAVSVFARGEMNAGDDDCGVVKGVPGAGVMLDSGCAGLVIRPSAATQAQSPVVGVMKAPSSRPVLALLWGLSSTPMTMLMLHSSGVVPTASGIRIISCSILVSRFSRT